LILYHGSSIGCLSELKPSLSEHGKSYIYFSTNPIVSLLYAVKPVPKPFSFYPYGFDSKGTVVYSEYFEDCFRRLYQNKNGYLYERNDVIDTEQPTNIYCAYTCSHPVKVDRVTKINDLYEYFLQQRECGLFKIKEFKDISEKEMLFVLNDMKDTVDRYDLLKQPCNPMHLFIKDHFPSLL